MIPTYRFPPVCLWGSSLHHVRHSMPAPDSMVGLVGASAVARLMFRVSSKSIPVPDC